MGQSESSGSRWKDTGPTCVQLCCPWYIDCFFIFFSLCHYVTAAGWCWSHHIWVSRWKRGRRDGQDFLPDISIWLMGEESHHYLITQQMRRIWLRLGLKDRDASQWPSCCSSASQELHTKPSTHPLTPAPLLITTFVIRELDCSKTPQVC